MSDNLAELLYTAWRSSLLSSRPDLPSWGNVRDPDVRAAWEAVAQEARNVMAERFVESIRYARKDLADAAKALDALDERWQR